MYRTFDRTVNPSVDPPEQYDPQACYVGADAMAYLWNWKPDVAAEIVDDAIEGYASELYDVLKASRHRHARELLGRIHKAAEGVSR